MILEATSCVRSLEVSDSHDEVVDKLDGNLFETSIVVIDPLLVHDVVQLRRGNLVLVEDDLTELQPCHRDINIHCGRPLVVRTVDDCRGDVHLNGFPKASLDPHVRYVQHNLVARVRLTESVETATRCLLGIVDHFGERSKRACL